jgi:hypothetical protein
MPRPSPKTESQPWKRGRGDSHRIRNTLEPAAKPDSVPSVREGGSHLSGARVTTHLDAAYPELKKGTGRSLPPRGTHSCLALLPVGFAWPRRSPASPVVSYTAVSPLPRASSRGGILSVALCRRVTPPGR